MDEDNNQDQSLVNEEVDQSSNKISQSIKQLKDLLSKDQVVQVWSQAKKKLTKLTIWQQKPQDFLSQFNISDRQIAEILAEVKEQLPTTEAWLIGKTQAGKSSIVRGLTGVSEEIVGEGFQPHTQHTERYLYPSADLPLLIFTDTVGLGDIDQETSLIIEELENELKQEKKRARILILTVKINDFATDTLRLTAQTLRQKYPQIPCLLAITCLHELYPQDLDNHPQNLQEYPELQRAIAEQEKSFAGLYDKVVTIDFTLEEDGFEPVFFGLASLRDNLAELLPEAEANTIYQLLDQELADKLGNVYRDVARRYLVAFATIAATLAAVPLPFATMPVLTALQVSMVGLLGKLYGQTLNPSQAGGVVSAIAGGFVAQAVGRELIKFIPGFGSAIAASWAATYTWALGEGACVYFGDLMGGKKPDPAKIQAAMADAFSVAKEKFKLKK